MTNTYLSENYAPVESELTAFDLQVIGELPAELSGRYLRNGPNPAGSVDPASHHWFSGDGMVHGVCLQNGAAKWYRNRYVGSSNLSALRGQADIPGRNWNDSGTGPSTSVGGFAGTTWAMVEAGGVPVELDYELETIGRNDFYGTLPGAFSAHPKYDPDSGEIHAMAYAWQEWMDHVQYVVVGSDGRVRRTVDIPLPGMSMIHDMSLTERYAVIYDQPVTVDLNIAMEGLFPFRWDPDYGNRVGLLPRKGSAADIIWIDIPLGYAFHPVNAYDAPDGTVVIDICNYACMFNRDILGPFGDDGFARLERWVLNPQLRSCSVTVIDASSNEFPRHNIAYSGRAYKFGYCVSPSQDPSVGWPTLKHNLETGAREVFDHGPGRAGGEPVFVARAGSSAEDEGWLIMLVHDLGSGAAELVVIDAEDFARGYVARVLLPQRVPFGFHGNWVSDEQVKPMEA